jgi:hypothetical protein
MSFTIKKIQRHGITLFAFNLNEGKDKPLSLGIVLRPTAEAIGLNPEFFETTLRRSKLSKVGNSVRCFDFKSSDFKTQHRQVDGAASGGAARSRPYQCLPLRKVEVLLNEVDTDRLKNPQARVSILNLQRTIVNMIEHYYHDGVAVNEKLLQKQPSLVTKLQSKIDKLTTERDKWKERSKSLEIRIKEIEARIDAKWEAKFEPRLRALEALIVRKNDTIRALSGKAVGNERQKNVLKVALSDSEIYTAKLRNKIRELRTDLNDLGSEAEKRQRSLSMYRGMVTVMRDMFPALTKTKPRRIPAAIREMLDETVSLVREAVGPAVRGDHLNKAMRVLFSSAFPEYTESQVAAVFEKHGPVVDAEPVTKKLGA